jgi:hypothetical protein
MPPGLEQDQSGLLHPACRKAPPRAVGFAASNAASNAPCPPPISTMICADAKSYAARTVGICSRDCALMNAWKAAISSACSDRYSKNPIPFGTSWRPDGTAVALAGSLRSGGEPAVEVVEDRFDGWPQLIGDLVLALTLTGAASGLGDDDLEDARDRDSP